MLSRGYKSSPFIVRGFPSIPPSSHIGYGTQDMPVAVLRSNFTACQSTTKIGSELTYVLMHKSSSKLMEGVVVKTRQDSWKMKMHPIGTSQAHTQIADETTSLTLQYRVRVSHS